MRGQPLQIQAIARATGCVLVAVTIAATAFHFRHDGTGASAPVHMSAAVSDPLTPELAHCQAIGMAAKDDMACEAAWAENVIGVAGEFRRLAMQRVADKPDDAEQPAIPSLRALLGLIEGGALRIGVDQHDPLPFPGPFAGEM